MRNFQVAKLSNTLIQQSLLAESNKVGVKYSTQKKPNNKSGMVATPSFATKKSKAVQQVEVPTSTSIKSGSPKRGKASGGIPQSRRADLIVDNTKVSKPSASKIKAQKAVKVAQAGTPTTSPKTKLIKKPKTVASGSSKSSFPSSKDASTYTNKMKNGSSNLGTHRGNNTPVVKAAKAATMKATTRPVSKVVTASAITTKGKVSATGKPTGGNKTTAARNWKTHAKGINVMESVQFVINGKPKAQFGIINRDVAAKLVESYEQFGYSVELYQGTAAWKQDREFLSTIFESVDAHYNNVPAVAKATRKTAMNRLFNLSHGDYSNMYESKQQFAQTIKAAFNRIMEQADHKYRRTLEVVECMARIETRNEVVDLTLITQARNTDMALRNFRNEIVEEYGFNTEIKHIFIDGHKYTPRHITEWTAKTKVREAGPVPQATPMMPRDPVIGSDAPAEIGMSGQNDFSDQLYAKTTRDMDDKYGGEGMFAAHAGAAQHHSTSDPVTHERDDDLSYSRGVPLSTKEYSRSVLDKHDRPGDYEMGRHKQQTWNNDFEGSDNRGNIGNPNRVGTHGYSKVSEQDVNERHGDMDYDEFVQRTVDELQDKYGKSPADVGLTADSPTFDAWIEWGDAPEHLAWFIVTHGIGEAEMDLGDDEE
jgi:hypothetical protein